ncbi:hypothetical protein [Erythrobacter rubeus]|uniref:Peptidase inhibitor I78 family protein n=1 Tax=Erythrobacter rubeus TaxID=2760803 RepID=A0ABR8KRU8_9SPHN|nr:hypothetical protein [Erythrobacter rubeus]MBD2841963.1 hypothetical protein [Erythrobacter rubeus]
MKPTAYKLSTIGVAMLLSACAQGTDNSSPSESASSTASPVTATTTGPSLPSDDPPPLPSFPPGSEPGDLPPCPGVNPDIRRPAGSNCLGVVPERCGADRVQQYVGLEATPELRSLLPRLAVSDFRWIPHMTAVTDDLNPTRMNVIIDADGLIEKIDCY